MKLSSGKSIKLFMTGAALCVLPVQLHAWEPNARDLEAAITRGDFAGYEKSLTSLLGDKAPGTAGISQAALTAMLKDPVVATALAQRHFIAKVGPDKLAAFSKADPANKPFLTWLLGNREALELCLEGATPVGLGAREDNSWGYPTGALDIWKKIYLADPDSREGIYLRLAIACGLRPPGSGAPGSGQQKPPSDPVVRYKYFKAAHANKELFPSFDKLTVWDYQFVVSSGGSEADLTWGREMVNTWRPDYRINEKVVDTTSQMWRRNSPIPHVDYKAVFAGGGKCGPRSSWSVFICQAFGIPAIGVGQPAHACVAFKGADGNWNVGYGRGWNVSKLEGLSGTDFVAGVESRANTERFKQVEHLRWLASALTKKESASAVMAVAKALNQAGVTAKKDLTASLKPEEMDAEPGVVPAAAGAPAKVPSPAAPPAMPEPPYTPVPGVINVNAADFVKMAGQTSYGNAQTAGVCVHDCFTGGKQVHFQAHMQSASVTYDVDVAEAGTYAMELKLAAANTEQVIAVQVTGPTPGEKFTVDVPYTTGLWKIAKGPELKLAKGKQTIEISHGFQRGVAFKSFDLKLQK